ncbi:MAG: sigma-54-dependent Fis family transcriptional regulator [Nitrospirae bacterium]|nr:MAG: sigma-54-dependent Fis family transcriptional regulator [Nitrospirota bacterium]
MMDKSVQKINILVVDDEEPVRRLLKNELSRKGFRVEVSSNGKEALKKLRAESFDIVLLDIVMPELDGIGFLKKIKKDPSSPSVIVLTGRATVETAVEAMKQGATDYLSKPYKLEELVILIKKAFEERRLRLENIILQNALKERFEPEEFVGKSPFYRQLMSFIKKIAPTDSSVLIQGESGTGKELVARLIWKQSKRSKGPFLALNCATFSENLIESELFGHEKGAFTNAFKVKYGLVEAADGGTLFLDEIAEMPQQLQAKLLRFLDSGEFRRVGGTKNLRVDVRVIAATNKNIEELIKRGDFREDLFYRLNVININLFPLRKRPQDIEPLVKHFIKKYNQRFSRTIKGISRDALAQLKKYDWPGNVRELENVIERAIILCDEELIQPEHLTLPCSGIVETESQPITLADLERQHIARVLERVEWNQSKASRMLGIDRKTLYLKIKRYGLKKTESSN